MRETRVPALARGLLHTKERRLLDPRAGALGLWLLSPRAWGQSSVTGGAAAVPRAPRRGVAPALRSLGGARGGARAAARTQRSHK